MSQQTQQQSEELHMIQTLHRQLEQCEEAREEEGRAMRMKIAELESALRMTRDRLLDHR